MKRKMETVFTWLAIVFIIVALVLWVMQKFPDVFVAMFFSFMCALMACVLFGRGEARSR